MTPRKSLKRLAQKIGVSMSSARMATQLLKPSSESWCLVCLSARRIVVHVFFNKIFTCRGTVFSAPPGICEQRQERPFIPNVIGMLSHW
jgi:hypothetical protein